jgi:hypothetical protein
MRNNVNQLDLPGILPSLPRVVLELTGADPIKACGLKAAVITGFFGMNSDDSECGKKAANCWNATLLFHGEVEKPQYCSSETMLRWLYEKCQPVKGRPQYGDVLAVFGSDFYNLEHTAVYVGSRGEKPFWHKAGYATQYTWEFVSKAAVLGYYGGADVLHQWYRPKPGVSKAEL